MLSILFLALSLSLTALAFLFHWPFFFLFLFIPFIPGIKERSPKRCPACGWETRGNEGFCPWDGTELGDSKSGHAEGKD